MGVLEDGLRSTNETGTAIEQAAEELVSDYRQSKRRIAGLGHRIHSDDPRTKKLFALAEEFEVAGDGVSMLQAIRNALAKNGKDLPINVDGAIAALLIDLQMPRELANAFFIMARVPGLVAHVHEEQTRQRPMRRIDPVRHEYDGPPARSLTKDA